MNPAVVVKWSNALTEIKVERMPYIPVSNPALGKKNLPVDPGWLSSLTCYF